MYVCVEAVLGANIKIIAIRDLGKNCVREILCRIFCKGIEKL